MAALNKPFQYHNRGFTLIEVVAVAACVTLLSLFCSVAAETYTRYVATVQLKQAAGTIVSEIRRLQQRSLVSTRAYNESITLGSDFAGYYIYRNMAMEKKVDFAQQGMPKVRFSSGNSKKISFGTTGGPNGTYCIRLFHLDKPGLQIEIEVQPVTGRVVVHEA